VLVLVAGGVAVAQGDASHANGYRTATVGTHTVDQTLERIGSIEPVSQASLSFATDGTVASVSVQPGDTVTVGQELARLDATSLETAVAEAQAALDAAELTLERALNGEDVSSPGGGMDGDGDIAPATYEGNYDIELIGSVTAAAHDPELAAAQQAVLDAQAVVDTNLGLAQQALDDAGTVCADLPTTATPSASETTETTVPASDPVAACNAALVAVLEAQQVVADSQNALADASRALDELLARRAEEEPEPPSTTTPPTTEAQGGPPSQGGQQPEDGEQPQGDQQASGDLSPDSGQSPSAEDQAGGGDASTGSSSSPSAAELVAYQKAVDAAAAELTVAEQAASQASLVSPLAGTVQAVDVSTGDAVSSGSSTAAVVVEGAGGYEVTTTVTVDDIPDLAVGQSVTVTPDGVDDPVGGEVVGIGTVGTSSGSSTTYPVTIGLVDPPDDLRNGVTASLSITTQQTDDAVAVPSSAVTVANGQAIVTVLDGGEASTVQVETGAIGSTWTEITDGLDVGQTVVLADLDEPLPSSATDSDSSGGGANRGGGPRVGGGDGPQRFPG
jgi:HlyD family secretion protein